MASPHTLKTSVCTVAVALAVGAAGIMLDPYQFANGMPYVAGGKNTEQDCKQHLWAITAKLQGKDLATELLRRRCSEANSRP